MAKKESSKIQKDTIQRYNKQILEFEKIQGALRESEKKYRFIIDNSKDITFIIGKTGKILFANKRALTVTGYSEKEVINKSITAFLAKDSVKQALRALTKEFLGRPQPEMNVQIKTKSGGIKELEIYSGRAAVHEKGKFIGILVSGRDTTDLKKAQRLLEESEEKYRAIFEGAGAGILGSEVLTKKFVLANARMCEITGYPIQELLKLSMYNIHPKKYLPNAVSQFEKLSSKKISIDRDVPVLRKDKRILYCDINASSLTIRGKKVLVGFFTDITDRRNTEEALRASEIKNKTLLESLPQKIFLKNKNLVYTSCNKNYARDLKIRPEEITGKTDYDFYPKDLAEKYRADDKRIIESGKTEDIEEKYIQDGQERFVHTIKTLVKDAQGNVVGVLGVFWDVTENKKAEEALQTSEEEFRVIFEGAGDGILVADAKTGKLVLANPRVCEITGYLDDELLKLNIKDIHPKKELPYVLDQVQKQLQGKILIAKDIQVLRKDGTIVYCDVSSRPIKIKNQELILGFFRDITERKKVEKQMTKVNKELELRIEELEKFSKLTVERELKMIELKKRVKQLEEKPNNAKKELRQMLDKKLEESRRKQLG